MDLFAAMPPSQLVTVAMDPDEPVPGLVYTTTLAELAGETVDALVKVVGPGSGSPLLMAELKQAGGALSAPANGAGARSHLRGEFTFEAVGLPMAPGMAQAINRHIDAACDALRPWSTDERYFNFADRPTELEALFDADTLAPLREVKRRCDPDDLIRANHAIGPEGRDRAHRLPSEQ